MNARSLMAVDIGNSWIKLAQYCMLQVDGAPTFAELPQPVWLEQYATDQPPPERFFSDLPAELMRWEISSVNRPGAERLCAAILAHRPQDEARVLTYEDLPIEVRVLSPERVGIDRLAATVTGNFLRRPDRAAIVIAAGTAVTVNFIGRDGAFEGGAILPGYQMQAKSLFHGADQLPLTIFEASDAPPSPLGRSTDQAIQSGLFWGMVGAVRELVTRLSQECEVPPDVFVTGGDVQRLASALGPDVRVVPNMVLSGIAIAAAGRKP
jgi:type III pantothenate kinase